MSKFIQYGNKTLTMPEGMTLERRRLSGEIRECCQQHIDLILQTWIVQHRRQPQALLEHPYRDW